MAHTGPVQVDIQVLGFSKYKQETRQKPLTNKQRVEEAAGYTVKRETETVNVALPYGTYRVKIRFRESKESVAFTTTWVTVQDATLGDNFKSVISFLGLNKSGTLPESPSILGWMKYATNSSYESNIRVAMMELTVETRKMIVSQDWAKRGTTGESPLVDDDGYVVQYDYKPTFGEKDPYVKGICDNVLDGDTIRITVDEVHNMPNVVLNKPLSVRLVGVLCPEIAKDEGDWYERNEKWAATHGLEPPADDNDVMDKICKLADEGKEYLTKILLNRRILVDPEINYEDTYGRVIGVVYLDQVLDWVGEGEAEIVICANTSMIANKSKTFPGFALGEPTYDYSMDKNGVIKSKFPLQTWWSLAPDYEQKLEKIQKQQQKDQSRSGKQAFLDKYRLKEVSGDATSALDNKVEVRYNDEGSPWTEDKLNNINDVPADSQYEDYENMVVDDRSKLDKAVGIDPYSEFHFRIGDCTFLVPPLSIRFDSLASNSRIQTLRSKSSMQTSSGHSSTVITVDLFFPNLASVNGYESKGPNGQTYYRNGLRPLLAQFKKAPFLPIENELINERFKIYSVALKDIEVTTVPGFPYCMQARLTLLEFDHTIYMPQEEDFAATFCWPLYRWYYQRSMQPQADPGRTHLKKIEHLDNKISFKIPDEGVLNARRQAIYDLDSKVNPQLFKSANSKDGTMMGEMLREANEVKMAREQYEGFKEALRMYPPDMAPHIYNSKGVFDLTNFSLKSADLKGDKNKQLRKAYFYILGTIVSYTYFYGEAPDGIAQVYFVINTIDKVFDVLSDLADEFGDDGYGDNGYDAWDFVTDIFGGAPVLKIECLSGSRGLRVYNRSSVDWDYVKDAMVGNSWTDSRTLPYIIKKYVRDSMVWDAGGVFVIEMKSSNAAKVPGKVKIEEWRDPIPAYHTINPLDEAMLKLITDVGEATELSFTDYEVKFEEINFKANMSEADVPELDFPIEDIYIQSMTASMHNSYAPLQLSSREAPTYQHLGSSDITMDLVIRTKSRNSVERFRQLMSTAQRLSREYRIAITSGVVTIDTAIMALFGVRSILIERLSVETSQEDKESFIVTISLIAFDKTQRLREDLAMVKAFGGTKEEAENAFYAYSKRRRNESGFEYALVDFTLRDLEVYPDLELPTFDELNKDLPNLKITYPNGAPFKAYPNADHAKFVDPDFYIRCEHTFRDYVYAVLEDGEIPVYLKDRLGFEGYDIGPTASQSKSGGMEKPNTVYSDETIQWIKEHLDDVYVGEKTTGSGSGGWNYSTDVGGVKTNMYDPKTVDAYEATNVKGASQSGSKFNMSTSVLSKEQLRNVVTKETVSTRPTDDEIKRWYGLGNNAPASAISEIRKGFRDPTENEFRAYLEDLVCNDTYGFFKSLDSDRELLKAGETECDTYKYGKTRVSAPKITREKVVNVLKALYDLEHSWKQFNSDGSVQWSRTNDIGIGQLNAYTSGILYNLDMARRAAWDWKYNLYKGVEFFALECYNFAVNGKKYNADAPVNPLDWAICCYNKGPVSGLKNYSQPQEVDYYNAVMSRFTSKYGADALYMSATPSALHNQEIADQQVDPKIRLDNMKDKVDMDWAEITNLRIGDFFENIGTSISDFFAGLGGEDYKEQNLDDDKKIKNYDEYRKYCQESHGVFVVDAHQERQQYKALAKTMDRNPDWNMYIVVDLTSAVDFFTIDSASKMDKDKQFVEVTKGAAQYMFNAYKSALKDFQDGKMDLRALNAFYHDKLDKNKLFTIRNATDFKAVSEAVNTVEVKQAVESTIVAPDDVAVLYRSCFSDMLEYDARGRLVRAFPTYQMFIIDEGRWMAWHKLWDNFYGYNSILSIDLCRDRRIAADTAIIGMTDIYHNLSTYDNQTSYGEWDYTLGDLIWGNKEARSKVWKTIWDLPDKDILAARRDELNSMMLKPGARIHLRLGYGSNAFRLPVVFNGTLSEMNAGELITIIAQGDGIELTNKLRVSPGDTNVDGILFKDVVEPRDFMGQMFTSKGNWLENLVSTVSGGVFYNTNPLGIVHFGVSEVPAATLLRSLNFFNAFEDYGECAQNIYCSAGINTMSQWIYTEGSKKGESLGFGWNWTDLGAQGQGGDEPNVKINLFDQTPWSVMQTFAHSCPDYITTVLPFEFRSTVFYGKPWWGVIDKYDYKYFYDTKHDMFVREPGSATRKSLSQMRIYSDYFDIISNGIKATEEYMYTNVIGVWDGGKKSTRVIQADSDINPDKQTTAIVHLINESDLWFTDKWTQSRYAEIAATSALRDYMKDMYQGDLVVMGDPTVKPYDRMHIQDNHTDMSGMAEVKRVVHHFSLDTGFITAITPDCISVIDDMQGISINTWLAGAAISVTSFHVGMLAKNVMWKKVWSSPAAAMFRKWGKKASNKLFTQAIAKMSNASPEELKTLEAISDNIVDYFRNLLSPTGTKRSLNTDLIKKELSAILRKNGTYKAVDDAVLTKTANIFKKTVETINTKGGVAKAIDSMWDSAKILKSGRLVKGTGFAARTLNKVWSGTSKLAKFGVKTGARTAAATARGAGRLIATAAAPETLGASILVEVAIEIGITILTAALVEEYGRWLKARQALTILPLKYRGKTFVAGVNGHKGLVAGEDASAWDKFLMGSGFGGDVVSGIYGFLGVDAPNYELGEDEATDKYMGN